MNIGTITSNATLTLKYITGKPLGTIEEAYIAKLQDGDRFVFGGKILQLVKIYDSTAYVKPAKGITQQTPTWQGGRLPFSPSLSYWLRMVLDEASRGDRCSPELKALDQLLNTQAHLSRIPTANSLLAEMTTSREGWHLFLFPFEGRSVHEALAILLALRLSRLKPATFTLSSNDYGLELLANQPFPFDEYLHHHAFSPENLLGDILEAANLSQLSKRHFRVIARVAGLVMQTYPGVRKSGRQVQASSSLIFDVFRRFDPNNLLVEQAQREVLEETFEQSRLLETLERLRKSPIALMEVSRPSPLAFPLMVERVGARISGESLRDRVERMKQQWLRQRQKRLSLPEKSFDFYPSTLSTGRPTAP